MSNQESLAKVNWPWWPLLPLYPYGKRQTIFKELIPNKIWCFEQLQGVYYVAVPVRLTVLKVRDGLMLINPLPPTQQLINKLRDLEAEHGPVRTIVLPTSSGLEHKVAMPSLARAFPTATLWLSPGQWSFPLPLPLSWLGIPRRRMRILFADGLPHEEFCEWIPLGPINIGLGRFQEVACYHKPSQSLHVTDALVGIEAKPPDLFNLDPTPLLFHARETGNQPIEDSYQLRRKGWARVVLFSLFLRPEMLSIPDLTDIIKYSFHPGLRNPRAHFGLYPFSWQDGWELSAKELVGDGKAIVQVAPVIQRLVFPRAKQVFEKWLSKLSSLKQMRWLISAHYSSCVSFTPREVMALKFKITSDNWSKSTGNWQFLNSLDNTLLKLSVVPEDPISSFKD